MTRRMIFLGLAGLFASVGVAAWTLTARAAYESAEYRVIETDGNIEIREYPDLMLAATDSKLDAQGRDGSFMRLFQYISGANDGSQKIAMTTPVFMDGELGKSDMSMGFVIPKDVAKSGVPEPKSNGVKIRTRKGGRFAVIRFAGQLNSETAKEHEKKLRQWLAARNLKAASKVEAAGYDPPFTPRALRRNEVLIRIQDVTLESPTDGISNE